MSRRAPGLTWLDRNDHKQQKWAHKYLQNKGEIDQKDDSSRIDQLLQIGEKLSSTSEGCSGLMIPDTHLGENARHIEVSDDQTTPCVFR